MDKEDLLFKTTREGRYLIRMVGAVVLALGIIIFFVNERLYLTPGEEVTPRYIFLVLLVIAVLIYLANRVYWNSYIHIGRYSIVCKGYNNKDPVVIPYDTIAGISGEKGKYIDIPGIDLDFSGKLYIKFIDGKEKTFTISASRKSIDKAIKLLQEHLQKVRNTNS